MQNILEALGKCRFPNVVRSVAVGLDDRDQYTITIGVRKPSGRLAEAIYRIAYRDAVVMPPEAIAYRLIEACRIARDTPEPEPEPEPKAIPMAPHRDKARAHGEPRLA